MSRPPLTIWEQPNAGYSRRDFLQFCSWIAAQPDSRIRRAAGGRSARLEARPRSCVPLPGMHVLPASRSSVQPPDRVRIILDKISLDYTETLQAAPGTS